MYPFGVSTQHIRNITHKLLKNQDIVIEVRLKQALRKQILCNSSS